MSELEGKLAVVTVTPRGQGCDTVLYAHRQDALIPLNRGCEYQAVAESNHERDSR